MTTTKAQIFNIVLNILGVSAPLENADASDNRAILLNNYYNLARDYVLKDFDWNFASTSKVLTLSPALYNTSKYRYCYDYPNDCICARDVYSIDDYVLQKFCISSLEDGSLVILTDVENAVLRYTRRVDKEIYFSCEFSMALAYYLASLVSNVLVGSVQKGEMAWEKYTKVLKHAKVINASEASDFIYDETTYINSRD